MWALSLNSARITANLEASTSIDANRGYHSSSQGDPPYRPILIPVDLALARVVLSGSPIRKQSTLAGKTGIALHRVEISTGPAFASREMDDKRRERGSGGDLSAIPQHM